MSGELACDLVLFARQQGTNTLARPAVRLAPESEPSPTSTHYVPSCIPRSPSRGPNSRTHFAIFIPHANLADKDLAVPTFKDAPCAGTIVQVVGEPLMSGFVLEFKRNFDCSTAHDPRRLALLGNVDTENIYD